MDDQNQNKQDLSALPEIVKALKDANNILTIISKDPSIDQLTAAIGLTIALNKADKHATAVFSGNVPPIIEFLEPDKTLEKNTNSLRDFIISLDKSKADKLRYKVEDNVVRIFITPYKTSISDTDLDFSQGDFNVDLVIALGVSSKADLDEAISAHGRILHDATIISLDTKEASELGSIHWLERDASSLSEMTTDLLSNFNKKLMDSQIATSLLTGVVYETDRFRNEKSTPHTMSVASILMEGGASTQLVATKLEEDHKNGFKNEEIPLTEEDNTENEDDITQEDKKDPGLIEIEHDDNIHIDDSGRLSQIDDILDQQVDNVDKPQENQEQTQTSNASGSSMVFEPPKFGGQLTANTTQVDQQYMSNPDPLTAPEGAQPPILNRNIDDNQTLSDLEKSVNSPHLSQDGGFGSSRVKVIEPLKPTTVVQDSVNSPGLSGADLPSATDKQQQIDYAQSAVERAVATADYKPEPIQALGAQPVGLDFGHEPAPVAPVGVNNNPSGPPPPPVPPPMMPQ